MPDEPGDGHRFERIAFLSSGTPDADRARDAFIARYGCASEAEADVVVALGGDGMMLQTLHRFMDKPVPIFGINHGSVGFLMNEWRDIDLRERLDVAQPSIIHPLVMRATSESGEVSEGRAINEVFLSRQTYQAAKLKISIDGVERLDELIADGVLAATPAGSTAYNLSVGGPILPLNTSLMTITPISAFRPRRWRGALLRDTARIEIEVIEATKRPVSAVADHFEVRHVIHVVIEMDIETGLVLLHDPGHSLDERILREQFGP
jgi:NAD+ kinase